MATKPYKIGATYRPFENLKELLAESSFDLSLGRQEETAEQEQHSPLDVEQSADSEEDIFQMAMADVEPIAREPSTLDGGGVCLTRMPEEDHQDEAYARLKDLVDGGEGFIISDTAEYMEGVGYGVNPDLARRLHRGDFSIQAHLDLHGLVAADAKKAFEAFLKESLLSRKTAVLVVHGRGLSSPAGPVLKRKVKEWLTTGPWRKWVTAFTSARACDGGTGATYILLRRRPATKRLRRKPRRNPLG
jgi:DNA-nicking Smr family endonuclease